MTEIINWTIKNILIVSGIIAIASCDFDTYNLASPQSSYTLQEAKESGVLIEELYPCNENFKINKDTSVKIESSWLEKVWFFTGDKKDSIRTIGSNQIIIKLNSENYMKDFLVTWGAGIDFNYGTSNGNIVIPIDSGSIKNKYIIHIFSYKKRYAFKNADVIDTLLFISKSNVHKACIVD